jgi:predicted permease
MMASRLYRIALRLLPRGFRARYGAGMLRMFEDGWAESTLPGRIRLVLRALPDLLWTAVSVRVSSNYATPPIGAAGGGTGLFLGLGIDVRAALRALARRPGFTMTAVITVGLGIGASVAVFTVVDGTVLRGLALPDRDRVVGFWTAFANQGRTEFLVSAAEQADMVSDLKSYDRLGAWWAASGTLVDAQRGEARTIDIALTLGDIYTLVAAHTTLGRLPDATDNRPGAARVAVLSHDLWLSWYGGRPGVIGTESIAVGLNETALIIGVLAPDIKLPGTSEDAWVHDVLDPDDYSWGRSGHGRNVIARLRAGVTLAQARAEIATLEPVWAARYAGQHSFGLDGHRLRVASIEERILGTAQRVALLLCTATVLLLALACANVANLLLARGETRRAETGVRLALGSSRARVARPVLLEALILSLGGGLLGWLLTRIGMPLLLRTAPPEISTLNLNVNLRVIVFALVVSVLAGLLFALIPSWQATRRDPTVLLRAGGRSRTGTTRGLHVLVGAQVALATILLAGAGLLTRSLLALNAVESGLDASGRVTLDLTLPAARYRELERIVTFSQTLRERVSALPGVQSVTLVRNLPMRDAQRRENVLREGESGRDRVVAITVQAGGPSVLRTLGIPLLAGRDLANADRAHNLPVVMVNQAAADALWPGQSVIGKRIQATFAPADHPLFTIVGVYGNVRSAGLSAAASPEILMPLAQLGVSLGWLRNLTLVVHTRADADAMLRASRSVVREIDPSIPAETPTRMADVEHASTARERFLASLLMLFAVLALAIAAVGVFGMVSFTVARRQREFAIRNALGAGRAQILRNVLLKNATIAGTGTALGVAVALMAAPGLQGFLYDTAPRDLLILTAVPLVLVSVALLSAMAPALRATRVPPAHALQEGD